MGAEWATNILLRTNGGTGTGRDRKPNYVGWNGERQRQKA